MSDKFITSKLAAYLALPGNRHLLQVIAAMAILSFSDNLVLTVMPPASLGQYLLVRAVICVVMAALVIMLAGSSWRPVRFVAVLVRSAFFAGAMGFYFGALVFLPVAEAAAGLFTAPIFVLVFSSLYLRQIPGWRRLLAVLAGSLGVVFLLQPGAADFTLWHLMPVAAGALYALANLIARHWCADEPPLALVLGYFILTGIGGLGLLIASGHASGYASGNVGGLGLAVIWVGLTGWQWISLLVQAGLTLLSVWMLISSYQKGDTTVLAISEYSFLGFAALFGWLIWGVLVSAMGWAGMVLITLAGALIIARSPNQQTQPGKA